MGFIEWSPGTATCITPSHQIYSCELERYLEPAELLVDQGIWRDDFVHPDVFENMVHANPNLAHSFAGNAFTSTMCQAAFLVSLVVSPSWSQLNHSDPDGGSQKNKKRSMPEMKTGRRAKPKAKMQPQPSVRLRRKTGLVASGFLKKRQAALKNMVQGPQGSKSVKARGKKRSFTIWEKEMVCQEIEKCRINGWNVKKHMAEKQMPGSLCLGEGLCWKLPNVFFFHGRTFLINDSLFIFTYIYKCT